MNKLAKFLILILLVLITAGCSSNTSSKPDQAVKQTIKYNIGAEPATLDPALAEGANEMTIENALLEGLVRMDPNGNVSPGMAISWEISDDGLTYTFNLREAHWSNGDPVTAGDFVYAWRRALAPETASPYAYQLYYLVNGKAYNSGELDNPAEVGVRAEGKDKLIVTLEHPVPYFLSLTAIPIMFPVHQKAVEQDSAGWAQNPASYICNGPFKLAAWERNQQLTLVKNENYWDRDNVKLEELVITLVADSNTELAMFESGQIDIAETPPYREMERLARGNSLELSPELSNEFYMFNTNNTPFNDLRVRRALSLAIDREALVSKVTMGGEKAAYGFVPYGVAGASAGSDFRSMEEKLIEGYNPEKASKLLAEAGFPAGQGFPKIELLLTNNKNHLAVAEAITGMWREKLGIETNINVQEYKAYFATLDARDFDIARVGWNADYNDPMTFLDLFLTDSPNNQAGWSNEAYDGLLQEANANADNNARMQSMLQAERILMNELPVVPIYYYTNPYLEKGNIHNVLHPSFAFLADFKWAYVS
ncbi:MAG: peptide ABC transporter substrate-binding protein [Pelotomaculum sp.]